MSDQWIEYRNPRDHMHTICPLVEATPFETVATARYWNEENPVVGKRVWDREPIPPLYGLDRPVAGTGLAPPCRLVMLTKRVTRKDQPGLLYFDATQLKWVGSDHVWKYHVDIVTGPSRLGIVWSEPPTRREWLEARKRIRLAAQLGSYIQAVLPELYR